MAEDLTDREMLIEIRTEVRELSRRQGIMENKLSRRFCFTHQEKIKTLERITWGTLLVSLAAMLKAFWGNITGAG